METQTKQDGGMNQVSIEKNVDPKMDQVEGNSEPVSEEEEFMQSLENQKDEEREKWDKEHPNLPQARQDAPTLLRAALKKGDSQSEEEKKVDTDEKEEANNANALKKLDEEETTLKKQRVSLCFIYNTCYKGCIND